MAQCKKHIFFKGETFRSLSFQYRIGERTISGIVEETCQALYEVKGINLILIYV